MPSVAEIKIHVYRNLSKDRIEVRGFPRKLLREVNRLLKRERMPLLALTFPCSELGPNMIRYEFLAKRFELGGYEMLPRVLSAINGALIAEFSERSA